MFLASQLFAAATSAAQPQSIEPAESARPQVPRKSPQAKPNQASDSIKGRVLSDGHPIAGASILAVPVNIASNPRGMMTSMLNRISSDAAGEFELTGLQAGAYTIAANSPGYILQESDAATFHRVGDKVTLTLVKGGVVTGRVTNSSGEPIVAASVRAIKLRDLENKLARPRGGRISDFGESATTMLGDFKTDDRGIYRIYGLTPGFYQVAAGGKDGRDFSFGEGGYDSDAPTYFPSSTIDTAVEVTVRGGDEVTGIDIRYRDHRGHSVSGRISSSAASKQQTFKVLLSRAGSGIIEASTFVAGAANENGFAFGAVLDGDYAVSAVGGGASIEGLEIRNVLISQPRRVTVSGGDVTGIELFMEPLASLSGRVVIEALRDLTAKADCKGLRTAKVEEVVVSTRSNNKPRPEEQVFGLLSLNETTPTETGEFRLPSLAPGLHHLDLQLPPEGLYVKLVSLPPANQKAKPIDAARSGVGLKSGDKITGMVATLSEGAAVLRGRVVTGKEDNQPQVKMRIHLIPAEPEAADDVVRYFEAEMAADGGFSMTNLAPGKYWLVARERSEQEQTDTDRKPVAWEAAGRLGLRFEGDATKKVIELSPCQRATDLVLTYTPLIKPSNPPAKKPAQ